MVRLYDLLLEVIEHSFMITNYIAKNAITNWKVLQELSKTSRRGDRTIHNH